MATKTITKVTSTLKDMVDKLGLHESTRRLIDAAQDMDNPVGMIPGRELTDLVLSLLVTTSNQGSLLGTELASNKNSGWERFGLKNKAERERILALIVEMIDHSDPEPDETDHDRQPPRPIEGVPLDEIPLDLDPHEEEAMLMLIGSINDNPGPGEDTFLRNTPMEEAFNAMTEEGVT